MISLDISQGLRLSRTFRHRALLRGMSLTSLKKNHALQSLTLDQSDTDVAG